MNVGYKHNLLLLFLRKLGIIELHVRISMKILLPIDVTELGMIIELKLFVSNASEPIFITPHLKLNLLTF